MFDLAKSANDKKQYYSHTEKKKLKCMELNQAVGYNDTSVNKVREGNHEVF